MRQTGTPAPQQVPPAPQTVPGRRANPTSPEQREAMRIARTSTDVKRAAAEKAQAALDTATGAIAGGFEGMARDAGSVAATMASGAIDAFGRAQAASGYPTAGAENLRRAKGMAPPAAPSQPGFEAGGRSAQPQPPSTAISPGAAVPAQQAAAPSAGKKAADRADLSFGIIGTAVKVPSSEYRAVETRGVEAYRKQKLTPIVEHYLRTGQPEKAAAFEKFLADKRTQEGMRSWVRAAHAYNMGDQDQFIDGIVGAYNSYFDDGYTAVKEKSEFERDGNGNITRAKIAFRNDETGEITFQVFEDTRDVVMAALGGLEPAAAFETLYGMTFGATKTDKPKAPTFDQITDAVQKRSMMDPAFAALPYDQQLDLMTRAAMAVTQRQPAAQADAGGDVPLEDPDQ
jgi:hypothetical protein